MFAADVERIVRESRAEQGLSPVVEDESALRVVASLLKKNATAPADNRSGRRRTHHRAPEVLKTA